MTPPKSSKGGKLDTLQILRGVAATLVLVSHAMREVAPIVNEQAAGFAFQKGGQFGVDIFFIISGFIMAYVTYGSLKGSPTASTFLIRRMFRVVPMYWIFTTITVVISLTASATKNHSETGLGYIISSYLFYPALREDGHITPALGVGWTLNYEMFFYVIFATCIAVRGRNAWNLAVLAMVALVCFGTLLPNAFSPLWYWTRPILLEFCAGLSLGYCFVRGWRLPTPAAAVIVLFGCVWWYIGTSYPNPMDSYMRVEMWGIPALLIVSGFMLTRIPIGDLIPAWLSRLAIRVGDCSYSIYLCHMFIVRILMIGINRTSPALRNETVLCVLILVVTSIMFAYLAYRFIEVPLTAYLDRSFADKRKSERMSTTPGAVGPKT